MHAGGFISTDRLYRIVFFPAEREGESSSAARTAASTCGAVVHQGTVRVRLLEVRRLAMTSPAATPLVLSEPLRLLLAEGDAASRKSLLKTISGDDRFVICAEAGDAASAVDVALRERPDLCIVDVKMPGGGIAAAWEIGQRLPGTTIVMLADSMEDGDFLDALRAGAMGYLLKDMNPARLTHALWDAHSGIAALPRVLTARVISQFRERGPTWRSLATSEARLSTREWQILGLIQNGFGSRAIASHLSLSPATVRSHRARIVRKLTANGDLETLERLRASADNTPTLLP
ncbi:MAG: response regulator [Gaiellaceae bacterium]